MKTPFLASAIILALACAACTDREAEAQKAKEAADVKVRADAAKKEMQVMPKAFQTPDYFKKNSDASKPSVDPSPKQK